MSEPVMPRYKRLGYYDLKVTQANEVIDPETGEFDVVDQTYQIKIHLLQGEDGRIHTEDSLSGIGSFSSLAEMKQQNGIPDSDITLFPNPQELEQ